MEAESRQKEPIIPTSFRHYYVLSMYLIYDMDASDSTIAAVNTASP